MAETTGEYRIYGRLDSRASATLASILVAKGLRLRFVEETPSLSWLLEARSGREEGPYLRTPEGFLLGGLHEILAWIERTHAEPPLVPHTPVRRISTLLLEDWIEGWLPLFADRSWKDLQVIGAHLERSKFLLGPSPTRADWLLAAWLETEVLVAPGGRRSLEICSPRFLRLGSELLESEVEEAGDDVLPISLLSVLERMSGAFHEFLLANQQALKDDADRVVMDLGLGPRSLPVSPECEARRMEIAQIVGALSPGDRDSVRRILEPVGAWHALVVPPVLEPPDAGDPRSL